MDEQYNFRQPQSMQSYYQTPQYQAPQPQYQAPQPQYQPRQSQPVKPPAAATTKKGTVFSCIGFAFALIAVIFALVFAGMFSNKEESDAISYGVTALVFCILGFNFGLIGLAFHGKKGFALPAVIISSTLSIAAIAFLFSLVGEIYSYVERIRHYYNAWF